MAHTRLDFVVLFLHGNMTRQADASGHVREMEEASLTLRNKFLAQVAARDREIQVSPAPTSLKGNTRELLAGS